MNVQYAVVDEVLQLQSVGNLINHCLLTLANLAPVKETKLTQQNETLKSNSANLELRFFKFNFRK